MSEPRDGEQLYIIIGGAGQVGYFLTKALIEDGHEVTLIEKDPRRVNELERELGESVLRGDACEVRTLEEAGCERAHYLLAVTGDDEDNLVMCQMAQALHTKRTIARVNNIANIEFFKKLGIDIVISPTQAILDIIKAELPLRQVVHLTSAPRASERLVEIVVPGDASILGVRADSLGLDSHASLVLIVREETSFKPAPDTPILAGDKLFAVVDEAGEAQLEAKVLGDHHHA